MGIDVVFVNGKWLLIGLPLLLVWLLAFIDDGIEGICVLSCGRDNDDLFLVESSSSSSMVAGTFCMLLFIGKRFSFSSSLSIESGSSCFCWLHSSSKFSFGLVGGDTGEIFMLIGDEKEDCSLFNTNS